MADLRWIPLFLLAGMIVGLTGCGGSTTNVQNPPAPATTPIAIAFTPAPVVSLNLASTTTFTAVVSNDASDAGVDWALLVSEQYQLRHAELPYTLPAAQRQPMLRPHPSLATRRRSRLRLSLPPITARMSLLR